jgi:hypothetical protein
MFGENGLLGAVIGLIAIAVTAFTIYQSRRQRQLDVFTRLHDQLTTQESQRARGRLFAAAEAGSWPKPGTPEWDEINRAVSMLETLALYIHEKIIDRKVALESWHHSLRRIREPAESFMALRRREYQVWPHLRSLFRQAESYRSQLWECCDPARRREESREQSDEARGKDHPAKQDPREPPVA